MTNSNLFDPGDGNLRQADTAAAERVEAEAAQWLLRNQSGLDRAGQAAFRDWLAADFRHGEEYAELQRVWAQLDRVPRVRIDQLAAAAEAAAHRAPPAWRLRWSAGAAMAVLLLGIGWGWTQWRAAPVFSGEYATGPGEQRMVALPDGSTLNLDADSRVRVTFQREQRQAILERGRSMFDVSRNPKRPFDVLAAGVRVHVVGTRFAVARQRSSLTGEDMVAVAVEEGHVRVEPGVARAAEHAAVTPPPPPVAELGRGQVVDVNPRSGLLGRVERVAPERVAPWRGGRTRFENVPLANVLAEFERHGDTGLRIRDPRVGALAVTGSFDLRQTGGFAKALPVALPVKLLPRDGKLEIALD